MVDNSDLQSSYVTDIVKQGVFFSRDGYSVEFDSDQWRLNKDIVIPVGSLRGMLGATAEQSFKETLAYFSKSHSGAHTNNLFYRCKAYLEYQPGSAPFSPESLISYRAAMGRDAEWYLSVIRGFVRQWVRLGLKGIPADTEKLLDQWVLKGNSKGSAVQSMCPDTGPLTDIEMQAVMEALTEAYASRRLSSSTVSCAMIIVMTGRRPGQVSALKIKDVYEEGGKYWINFPRAKQRGLGWRSKFNKFLIIEDLWLLLQEQVAATADYFACAIGQVLPSKTISELPLFPVKKKHATLEELKSQLSGDFLHLPVADIKTMMEVVSKTLVVNSERTGASMHLNSRRFRYTLGTNLAREGNGEFVIAEALDHSDIQNAGVYVKNLPDIVERIDRAVAMQLAPIAQAFKGVLVTSESVARRGNDPSSRISNGVANVGNCGSYGFCGALAPIACYTCVHFQPWINGPHEEVLSRLIDERDRVSEQTGDIKIASANDRLILAVGDVIHRCQEARGGVSHG